MATLNNLPVYSAQINDIDEGMFCISLVKNPATESNFLYFKEDKKPLQFSIQDEEKHIIFGLVMGADTPIYRISPWGEEYYIIYSADVIRKMATKFLKDGCNRNVDTNHNDVLVNGVDMVQLFIKDSAKGINPAGFEDVADGSLFAEYHIDSIEIWDKVKSGEFQGFSLAGCFTIEEIEPEMDAEEVEIYDLLSKIMNKLSK